MTSIEATSTSLRRWRAGPGRALVAAVATVAIVALAAVAPVATSAAHAQEAGAPTITSIESWGDSSNDPCCYTAGGVDWTIDPLGVQPTHHRVELVVGESGSTAQVVGSARSYVWWYLTEGETYEVRLSACAGTGEAEECDTATSTFTVPVAPVPHVEVAEVQATPVDPNTVDVSWTYGPATNVSISLVVVTFAPTDGGPEVQTRITDSSRSHQQAGLDPGTTYEVSVGACYVPRPTAPTWYCGSASTTVTTLPGLGSASGVALGPGGQPVPGTVVALYAPTDGWYPTISTEVAPDGSFSFDGVPPGTYAAVAVAPAASALGVIWYGGGRDRGAATPIAISAATPVEGIVIDMAEGASIGGRLTRGGAPVAGAYVMAFAPADRWMGTGLATTDADGNYRFAGLPAGGYRVLAVDPAGEQNVWYGDTVIRAASPELVVSDLDQVDGIDIDLEVVPSHAAA